MEKEPKKKKTGLITKILAGFGVLFIVLLIIGCDEEEPRTRDEAEVSVQDDEDESKASSETSKSSSGKDTKSVTVMIYMNGSDLESKAGEATEDISEMLSSGIGDNVNVVIQTMGTKKWHDYGISSKTAQTYEIRDKKLVLVRDDLGQLNCTSRKTLSEFISFCKSSYPADRYILHFWDHGGGPVYGFGYDEWQSEEASLTISEMAGALKDNKDIHFDLIGMDCCIMASMETLYAFAPYCKYALLSEDFESGLGWSYKRWMKKLEKNPDISTPLLGKYIIDDIIKDNEEESGGDSACLGLFNVSTSKKLYKAWKAYAYKNESELLGNNYSRPHRAKGRSFWDLWGDDESDVTMEDYYISDILALVEGIDGDSDEAKELKSALRAAVAYYGHTSDKNELTGLAVSLPYGDQQFYGKLSKVYKKIGLDDDYVDWLGNFVSSRGADSYYDYDDFEDSWDGWGGCDGDYGCSTTGEAWQDESGEYYDDGYYDDGYYDDGYYNDYYYDDGYYDDGWVYDYEDDSWYCGDDCYYGW